MILVDVGCCMCNIKFSFSDKNSTLFGVNGFDNIRLVKITTQCKWKPPLLSTTTPLEPRDKSADSSANTFTSTIRIDSSTPISGTHSRKSRPKIGSSRTSPSSRMEISSSLDPSPLLPISSKKQAGMTCSDALSRIRPRSTVFVHTST